MILKEIPGYSKYLAREDGTIISKKTGCPVREKYRKDGYVDVLISPDIGPKYKLNLQHRLICKAFYGDSHLYVNHKNGIKNDNNYLNLEWVTAKQNIAHARDILGVKYNLKGFSSYNRKVTKDMAHKIIKWHGSRILEANELAKFFGICKETVMIILRNKKRIFNEICK